MGYGGEWSCNSPRTFAGSDWGCQSFAAEVAVCGDGGSGGARLIRIPGISSYPVTRITTG